MVARLNRKLEDRLKVTPETLTVTRRKRDKSWPWEALQEDQHDLVLIVASGEDDERRGVAKFEGADWLELRLEAEDSVVETRWRRSQPASPQAEAVNAQ